MPAIERRSGRLADSSPARQRASSSTWIAFIGSTYGLRSRIERWITEWAAEEGARIGVQAGEAFRVVVIDEDPSEEVAAEAPAPAEVADEPAFGEPLA